MVAIVGSRRANLPLFPEYRMSPSMKGGNIFRRGLDFVKRNAAKFLRSGARLLPGAIDTFVRLGAERGHIPSKHKNVYDQYSKYVHMFPSLINRPLQRLEERLNAGLRPVTEIDSKIDDLSDRVLKNFERSATKALAPKATAQVQQDTEGGAIEGQVISIKTRKKGTGKKKKSGGKKDGLKCVIFDMNKGKTKGKSSKERSDAQRKRQSKSKIPSMDTQEYKDKIMAKLVRGSGLMTHSLTTE